MRKYELSHEPVPGTLIVKKNKKLLIEGKDYMVDGSEITFTKAPERFTNIDIKYPAGKKRR